jgi:hypothetical protein
MTLDAKLRWKARVKENREESGPKYKQMYWKKIGPVDIQADAVRTNIEACVGLWQTVVGMHETEQHLHH